MLKLELIVFIPMLLMVDVNSNFYGKFWHICDIHLNNSHNISSNDMSRFGNYKNDSTFALFQSSIQHMANACRYPDFIIVNGDNSYHGKIPNSQLNNSISNITGELKKYFPSTAILPSLGNHDVNPANLISEDSTWCQNFYMFWKPVLPNISKSDIETFQKGCYYTHSIDTQTSKLVIIVLNTLLWYEVNYYFKTLSDPLDQFMWLEHKLKVAQVNNAKVFLVAHVPPGASEASPTKFHHLHPKFNQRFLKIMQDFADIIDAGFFAHQHTDAFKIVYGSNNEPVIPLLLSPSVTPFNLWKLGSVNPSVRLYNWNGTSAESGYQQYHTHIPTEYVFPEPPSIEWKVEYLSSTLFQNLSAKSLDSFVSEFSLDNSHSFQSFFSYHLSGQLHYDETCPKYSSCRCRFICGIKNIDYTSLDVCLNKCQGGKYSLGWIAVPIILTLLIIFFAIFLFRKIHIRRSRSSRNYESL